MKLSDRQKKKIISEYVNGDGKISKNSLAKKYGVSFGTISSILSDEKSVKKCELKKKENEKSMLSFFDERKEKAQSLIDEILTTSAAQIKEAPLRDKMGALKILSEVFKDTSVQPTDGNQSDAEEKLLKALTDRKVDGIDDE